MIKFRTKSELTIQECKKRFRESVHMLGCWWLAMISPPEDLPGKHPWCGDLRGSRFWLGRLNPTDRGPYYHPVVRGQFRPDPEGRGTIVEGRCYAGWTQRVGRILLWGFLAIPTVPMFVWGVYEMISGGFAAGLKWAGSAVGLWAIVWLLMRTQKRSEDKDVEAGVKFVRAMLRARAVGDAAEAAEASSRMV